MCIIGIINNKKAFGKEEIENCYTMNSDGVGIAYVENNDIYVVKGLIDVDSVISMVKKLHKTPFVIHFRLTSAGYTSVEQCHPFPISEEYEVIERGDNYLIYRAKAVLFHNGTIYDKMLTYLYEKHFPNAEDLASDTQMLSALIRKGILDVDVLNLYSTANKFVVLTSSGEIKTYGTFVEDRKNLYSNHGYACYSSFYNRYAYIWSNWYDIEEEKEEDKTKTKKNKFSRRKKEEDIEDVDEKFKLFYEKYHIDE